jgi:mono/diheme cytochrome c family protein
VSPALVENQVRKGSANKLMPALEGALTDAQIKAVAAWVASPAFLQQ